MTELPRLMTGSYREALAAQAAGAPIVLVRTSLGKPKWIDPAVADAMPTIEALTPQGWYINADDDTFRRRYRHQLHRTTVPVIDRELTALLDANPGKSLCLLCFEDDPADCHRALFARWWLEKTGEAIYELGVPGCPVAMADPGYRNAA